MVDLSTAVGHRAAGFVSAPIKTIYAILSIRANVPAHARMKTSLTDPGPVLDCAGIDDWRRLGGGERSGSSAGGSEQDGNPRIPDAGYPGRRGLDEDGGRGNLWHRCEAVQDPAH